MREAESKLHMAQNRDHMALQTMAQSPHHGDPMALQEAPDLNRGKSQSFVMDISDWVLNLDNNDPTPTPTRRSGGARHNHTPRTNGRESSSPLEKLPFNMIEVPTASTADSGDERSRNNLSRSSRSRSASNSKRSSNSKRTEKKKETKKKSWFRRG